MRSRRGFRLGLVRLGLAVVLSALAGQVSLQQPVADGRRMPVPPLQLEREAHDHYRAREWALAAEKYEQALAAEPDLAGAYFYLANCYDNLSHSAADAHSANLELLSKAVDNYRKAADLDPNPRMRKLALEYLRAAYEPQGFNDAVKINEILERIKEFDETR